MLTNQLKQTASIVTNSFSIAAFMVILSSCASTSKLTPGNPLPGIALEASAQEILFSWSDGSPVAYQLRPNAQVQVLASYDTQNGPVTNEVVANASVRAGINGLKLKLKDSTKFLPSGRVCLRLATAFQPIPLRIARLDESSSGFYYDEWSVLVNNQKTIMIAELDLNNAQVNVNNYSKPDRNFENYKIENQLNDARDCDMITNTVIPERPKTALEGGQRAQAVAEQCVLLYRQFVDEGHLPMAKDVAAVLIENNVLTQDASQMQKEFEQYSPGQLWFAGSRLPIDNQTIIAWLKESSKIPSVAIASLGMQAYQSCKREVSARFAESYADWKRISAPEIMEKQIEPMRRLCQARFAQNEKRLQELAFHQQTLGQAKEALAQAKNASNVNLPASKKLIPHACPAETF